MCSPRVGERGLCAEGAVGVPEGGVPEGMDSSKETIGDWDTCLTSGGLVADTGSTISESVVGPLLMNNATLDYKDTTRYTTGG